MKSIQKRLWYGFMKIWFILGHSKVNNLFMVNFFYQLFFTFIYLIVTYDILNPYNISQIKFIHKNACIEAQITNQSMLFNFKSPLLYIWCIYVAICFYRHLLFQVENLNIATNLKKYYFYVMFITCKCTQLCKKLYCDTKDEPPYLVTTLYNPKRVKKHKWKLHKNIAFGTFLYCNNEGKQI